KMRWLNIGLLLIRRMVTPHDRGQPRRKKLDRSLAHPDIVVGSAGNNWHARQCARIDRLDWGRQRQTTSKRRECCEGLTLEIRVTLEFVQRPRKDTGVQAREVQHSRGSSVQSKLDQITTVEHRSSLVAAADGTGCQRMIFPCAGKVFWHPLLHGELRAEGCATPYGLPIFWK